MRMNYHVTKTSEGWQGKLQDTAKPVATGKTKKEVMQKTIEIAKRQPLASVKIHKQNGQIQEERTYPRSSDPHNNKG